MTGSARLSISDATAWTQALLAREWRLTLPVALALIGLPALVVGQFVPDIPAMPPAGDVTAAYNASLQALRTVALFGLPVIVFMLLGLLAVSILAATPGVSVAEALKLAVRRFASLLGAVLLAAAIAFAASTTAGALLTAMIARGGRLAPPQFALIVTAMILVMGAVATRFCLLTAVIGAEGGGPIAALRRSWLLSRGHFWRLYALLVVLATAMMLIPAIVQIVLGVLIVGIGRLIGQASLALELLQVVLASVNSAILMAAAVLIVAVYRQIEASRGI